MSYYKALPDSITVKESSIEGLGLYAKQDINKGDIIGESLWCIPSLKLKIRTPLGGFASHDRKANVEYAEARRFRIPSVYLYTMVAIKDIKEGEEILLDYRQVMNYDNLKGEYNGAEWL